MEYKFTAPFQKCVNVAFVAVIPIGIIEMIFVVVSRFGGGDDLLSFRDVFICLGIFMGLGVILAVLFYASGHIWKIAIRPDMLGCAGNTGFRKYIPWSSIQSVSWTSMMGLPYLVIRSSDGYPTLSLPLWMVEEKEFGELVYEYAGAENPLSQWFSQNTQEA